MENHDLGVVTEVHIDGSKRANARQRLHCDIAPSLVMKIRGSGNACVQFGRPEGALPCQCDSASRSLNDHRLVSRRMAWRGEQSDSVKELVLAANNSQSIGIDRGPFRDGVTRILGGFVLGSLNEHGRLERGKLAAMIEMKVRDHDGRDVGDAETDRIQGIGERDDHRPIRLVDPCVIGTDAGVDEKYSVAVSDDPSVYRERREVGALGMP